MSVQRGGKKHHKNYGIENYDVEFGGRSSRRARIRAWGLDPLAIPEKATYDTPIWITHECRAIFTLIMT